MFNFIFSVFEVHLNNSLCAYEIYCHLHRDRDSYINLQADTIKHVQMNRMCGKDIKDEL